MESKFGDELLEFVKVISFIFKLLLLLIRIALMVRSRKNQN